MRSFHSTFLTFLKRSLVLPVMVVFMLTLLAGTVLAQDESGIAERANYELASKFNRENIRKLTYDLRVNPNWLKDSDKFWYKFKTAEGTNFYLVDPPRKLKTQIFDNDVMAARLTEETNNPHNAKDLKVDKIEFIDDNNIVVTTNKIRYDFNLQTTVLTFKDSVKSENNNTGGGAGGTGERNRRWKNFSPDSSVVVFAKNHNLFKMLANDPDSAEVQLTTDGERWYSYAANSSDTTKDKRIWPNIGWFKDSKKFTSLRRDRRHVGDLWVINSLAKPRPTLQTYKYSMPGEENVPQSELFVFDVESNSRLEIDVKKWKDQTIGGSYTRGGGVRRGKSSDKVYYIRLDRPIQNLELLVADTETGEQKVLITETSEPIINIERTAFAEINGGEELIWWSERTGWGHLYLYDGEGNLKNPITSGSFNVQGITKIDTANQVIYFTANGREKGVDLYYNLLYRVNFDGSNITLLSPENATHSVSMSESRKFVVDNYSRIDMVPEAVLKDNTGKVLLNLEKADISKLEEAGWKMPETFIAKSADGITDQYGVMWKPFDFDPKKKYPIITYVYPGRFSEAVPKSFSPTNQNIGLAQLGFIVVAFGNRGGSPQRGKWYHTYDFEHARDYGLADKKAVLENLANRHDFIDINRVGIYGHSGGGFMSTAAMLVYPDFFKVAVSSAGNHDNNMYNQSWGEYNYGVKEVKKKKKKEKKIDVTQDGDDMDEQKEEESETEWEVKIQTNPELAKNLKGHLLLAHGDIDSNVHPGNTTRLVDALIKAGKRFDFMVMPGKRHGFGDYSGYFERMKWDYFAEHLLGDYRTNVEMYEIKKK